MHADIRSKLRQVDVCFVMDTTGSMGAYIQATRTHIQKLSVALSKADVKPQISFGLERVMNFFEFGKLWEWREKLIPVM